MAKKKTDSRDRLRKVPTTVYLEPEQAKALEALCKRTRVLQTVYLREAVDLLLAKYREK